MIELRFETKGFKPLAANMRGARTVVLGATNRLLRDIGDFMVPLLKQHTPVRTGRLRNSTRYQVLGRAEDMQLQIRQGAKTPAGDFYGHLVRGGTRPHIIRPRNARALVFQMGDRTVFARQVRHPGTKPNPYHLRALNRGKGRIQQLVKDTGVKIVAQLMNIGGNR